MKKELLYSITKKDLEIQTFRAGGPGGQNQNKRNTGVRIIHRESGAVGEARDQRTQLQNKKNALHRLVESPKFKIWNARRCKEIIEGKTIEQKVEESMTPDKIKVEIKEDDGEWVEWKVVL
jgi:protein subunit release factor A